MKDYVPTHCPKCRSWRWFKEGEMNNGGYSYTKGLIGTAVFGPIGAVAGINGKKSNVYVCKDCGYSASYKK